MKKTLSHFFETWKAPIIIAIGIILILLTMPHAGAVELTANQVSSYSFDAPAGNVIYQILVDQLPMGVNQSHTFKVGTATYFLKIESSNPYSIYYDFDIAWTLPNGTTQKLHKSITRLPGAGYKVNIQPVYSQAESASFVVWTIDLEIGTTNQSVSAAINSGPVGWSPSDAIPFTSAAGEFGTNTNVYLYQISVSDFQNHVKNYDPAYGLQNLGSTVFQWTWEHILGFINQIPIVGPQFVSLITVLGTIVGEISIWIVWILMNLPAIIAAGEVTIVMLAFILAEKDPKPQSVMKNIYNYNVAAVLGFVWLFEKSYYWLLKFIEVIAAIARALNPL